MGLDQNLYAGSWTLEQLENPDLDTPMEELMYWRKHNRLQGYMKNIWMDRKRREIKEKIIATEDQEEELEKLEDWQTFNCDYLELSAEDIDAWEAAVNGMALPETSGFFFGGDSYDGEDGDYYYKKHDLEAIDRARNAIAQGLRVYYWSWW